MIVTIPMRMPVRLMRPVRAVRWPAALAISLVCHALLLAMLPMLGGVAFPPERPIAVTLLGGSGGGTDGQGEGGGGAPPGSGAAAAVAVPIEEAKPIPVEHVAALAPPVAVPAPRPRAETARRAPPRPAPRREVAPEASADDPAGSETGSEALASARGGDGIGSGIGEGDGGAGSGLGAGSGAGAGHGEGTGRGDGNGAGDLRASCASCPAPDYPARARRQGWQGTVDVQVRVGGDGAVEEAQVGRSSGFAALDTAAVNVARRSRFRVAGGSVVSGQLRYRFVLEAGERPL